MKRLTRAALAAAAIALVVPVSGCAALLSNQQTHNYIYHGGDGAWATVTGVEFRGVLLIANEDNSAAQLFYTVVNNSQKSANVTISVGDYTDQFQLEKGAKKVQNPESSDSAKKPAIVKGLTNKVGEQVDVKVTANGEEHIVRAQILNGDHWYYEKDAPTTAPTDGAATPTPEATEAQ